MNNFNETDNNKINVDITSIHENERSVENQNSIAIDIPNETEERNIDKKKKEKEHVNFFKQFLLPRVYITAIISFVVIIIFNIVSGIILEHVFHVTTNSNEEGLNEMQEINPTFTIIYVCIIGPIIEELIFRRLIFWLIKKFSVVLAYLVSSFLFAFGHFGFSFSTLISEIYFFPVYFIMGVIFAYTYNYDGYILASMLSHILNNTAVTLLSSL